MDEQAQQAIAAPLDVERVAREIRAGVLGRDEWDADDVTRILTALVAAVRQEEREKQETLAAFGAWLVRQIRDTVFSGEDVYGGDVQDEAERLGILTKEEVTMETILTTHAHCDMDEGSYCYHIAAAFAPEREATG